YVNTQNIREHGQIISLLLKEFEETSSDWLFEVDADGRLARVSERFASMLGQRAEALEGQPFETVLLSVADEATMRRGSPLVRLRRAARRRAAFRDVVVSVTIGGEQRWWSLTGKPVFGSNGQFAGYRGVGSDVTEAKRSEAVIERMATYDSLTGLPNRNLFHLRLSEAMRRQRADKSGFAVLSLDLDRFKSVNDTLGHAIGDALLVEAAARIRGELGANDIVARFGGDEFVILQDNIADVSAPRELAERLVKAIGEPYSIEDQRLLIGASIGIAPAFEDAIDPDDLLRNSDLALYRAKADGKGRYSFYAAEMDARMQARRLLEVDLRDAIVRGALEVYFQPVVDISSGTIRGCEALARWRHPTRGFIPPAEFIPLAEETGLVVALGAFVLRAACREAVRWPREQTVAINLSVVQFRSGDLVDLVGSTLRETGLSPDRLELEITESVLIEDRETVLAALTELRSLGIRISLDDFGTGYSSLSYISSFPFDKIKIDRSFVRNVANRPDSAAVISAITRLAATLGMCTTAEGVESAAELDWLRQQGCREVQGFLFSSAVTAEEVRMLLGSPNRTGAAPAPAERAA
ncbi:MAG: EAL domain-containing protein, partial [Hyphomicrobiales bacterium]|nr:EAL domain-containing protein [Hyphomicrobiales bacterium]